MNRVNESIQGQTISSRLSSFHERETSACISGPQANVFSAGAIICFVAM